LITVAAASKTVGKDKSSGQGESCHDLLDEFCGKDGQADNGAVKSPRVSRRDERHRCLVDLSFARPDGHNGFRA
jgi:hypothetical protein